MATTPTRKPDLAAALLLVKGVGERTTAAYHAALKAFLASGAPTTVEGFASYIHHQA